MSLLTAAFEVPVMDGRGGITRRVRRVQVQLSRVIEPGKWFSVQVAPKSTVAESIGSQSSLPEHGSSAHA